jgi:DNA segregation ATPase FtsK/SpoIIIE, S-DNA-T family
MAKTKKAKSGKLEKDLPTGLPRIGAIVKDDRTIRILGALLIVVALVLFVAFISHAFTWKADQDKMARKAGQFLFNEDVASGNWLGRLGTYFSHLFITEGFGIAAYLIPTFLFALGLNLFSATKIFNLTKLGLVCLIGLPLIALICTLFLGSFNYSFGGAVGNYLFDKTTHFMGKTGLILVLALLGIGYAVWKFNYVFSVPKVPKWMNKENADVTLVNNDVATETQQEATLLIDESFAPKESKNKKGATDNKPLDLEVVYKNDTEDPAENNMPLILNNEEGADVVVANDTIDEDEDENVILSLHHKKDEPIIEPTPKPKTSIVQLPNPVNDGEAAATSSFGTLVQMPNQKPGVPIDESLTLEINTDPIIKEEDPLVPSADNKPDLKKPYDPFLDLKGYKFPSIDLLENHGSEKIVQDPAELENYKNQIIATLKNYDIHIQRISATVGPTVTLYEIVPAPGIRISRIKNLEDDIALSLAALGIRIIAPIPGRGTIGIEVPNVRKTVVSMKTLIGSDKFNNNSYSLPIAIGKRIDNENFIVDLATMPHLLMAGATGQGKSVGLNAILVSLLYKKHPSQLKFVLVDPKKVELSIYKVIENHFLAKLPNEEESIITDTKKVVYTLNALCIEMDNRYDLLKDAGCRNIKEYNDKFIARRLNPEKGHQYLPFIVLVVDEFADLIMTAGKEVETPIARLAQLARAVGIHLIIATQRPSVNIITGTIKANFPARIAFKVSSKIDSRTILDTGGAEQLIGKGDMLISYNGELTRLQCAFVDTPEVEKVSDFIGDQRGYPQPFLLPEYVDEKDAEARDFDMSDRDTMFEDAARLIVQNQLGSTSLIQRRMKLGYNRAGRIMEQMEAVGIVGPSQGSKPREVYVKTEIDLIELLSKF